MTETIILASPHQKAGTVVVATILAGFRVRLARLGAIGRQCGEGVSGQHQTASPALREMSSLRAV